MSRYDDVGPLHLFSRIRDIPPFVPALRGGAISRSVCGWPSSEN